MATLLIDLLTEKEDAAYENSFDIDLLAGHLVSVTNHIKKMPIFQHVKIGYFGADTGAAAALKASVQMGNIVHAVVSRGGRPNLTKENIAVVKSPTLLIVGGLDNDLIEFNLWAYNLLQCEKKLEVVEGASHLLEEPGKLEEVARLTVNWFAKHLHPDALLKP